MTTLTFDDLKTEIEAAWEARDGVSVDTKGPVRTAVDETLRLLDEG
ncbi:MAG: 2,3,4,5-tetrahydropyridine-2,6-dicarboxylate N-succinyltransferase, partial [Pseudomonadota bacterium]